MTPTPGSQSTPPGEAPAIHWDEVYRARSADQLSWFQAAPAMSMELLDALAVPSSASVIDVGAGASGLVDRLLERGFDDITLLDVSEAALETARARLPAPVPVSWLGEDLLSWRPRRRFDVWHDRAVFHFLTTPEGRRRYQAAMRAATLPGAAIIVATFAADGPDSCSGLPVMRYDSAALAASLGSDFEMSLSRRELHVTPSGLVQPFTWVAGRRGPAAGL